MEDYIKVIYKLQRSGERVSTSDIARAMRTTPASATKMSKYLAEHNLVTREAYYGVRLTPVGEKIALETIRHHRLIELYLVEALGYGWDEVDAEAERLEHHISEAFEERIDALLGRPQTDPHGDPIPTRDGTIAPPHGVALSQIREPGPFTVVRVSDQSAEVLRQLTRMGISLGATLEVAEGEQGHLIVAVGGSLHTMDAHLTDRVFVTS